ncbi:type II toxin-antitoxin system HipA family toxin [Rhodococcus sp. NPDC056516]|uniref:type II toxin-antitoxin system HipA family toxin n=1 Tax=Rhodococcus sp. NPDC056516 TaxID=3345847 RepID=UPI00366C2148
MSEAAHAVLLHGERVGTILQRGDVARFIFVDEYWEDSSRNVLGLWFEDDPRRSPQAALRLPPWFSNLLPEGRLRDWIARDQGVSVERELQLLLRIGNDLPGAVQVLPFVGEMDFDPDVLADTQHIVARNNIQASPWKFSLAGVGLKFSLLKQNERLTIPMAGAVGDWIVKFPDATYSDVPANEFATMSLAGRVGINIPEISLVHRDELPPLSDIVWPGAEDQAYAVARFDRAPGGRRIHIEDLAQVRGFYDDRKYHGAFETVAALIYRGKDTSSLREFIRRLTFNILIGNGDAHLKNWSLIYPDGRIPTLSPAYDLVSTAPYANEYAPDDFGLKFNGTKILDRVDRSSFEQLQRRLGVDTTEVIDIVDATVEMLAEAWRSGARETFPPLVGEWVDARLPHVQARLSK